MLFYMKIILILSSVILFVVSGMVAGAIPSYVFEKYIKRDVVFNFSAADIVLYPESTRSSRVVGFLGAGESIPHEYDGLSGQWIYGRFNNLVVSLRDGGAVKANLVFGYPISDKLIGSINLYSLYVLLISVLMLWIGRKRDEYKIANRKKFLYQNQIDNLQSEKQSLKDENSRMSHTIHQLKIKVSEQERKLLRKKDEWDGLLKKLAEEESRVRDKKVELSDLQDSYNLLEGRFKQVVDEAKLFDFPYENKFYESLLKGRKYELRVAKSFYFNGGKILEWTPDKGFDQNMYVESNNNPDLVMQFGSNVFAVECKYRGYFFEIRKAKYKYDDEISWATQFSVNHYSQFSLDRNMPVFLALGFLGDPNRPSNEYLVRLNNMLGISEDRKWEKKDPDTGKIKKNHQKIIRQSDISEFIVKDSYMALTNVTVN